jgi:hypothetical protein
MAMVMEKHQILDSYIGASETVESMTQTEAENYFKEALSLGIIDNDPCLSLAIFKINENNFKEATPILKKLCDRFSWELTMIAAFITLRKS